MLQIYLEPFKLFAKSENAVAESHYQNAIALRQNQCLVNDNRLTLSCFTGLTGEWEGQVGGGMSFSQVKGWPAYEI